MANRIKELRKQNGLTLQDLADRSNCSRDQVWRLEQGDRGLTDEWMRRLAAALKCKASDFLPEEDFSPRLDHFHMQMLADIRALSPDNRSRLARIVTMTAAALDEAEQTGRARDDKLARTG